MSKFDTISKDLKSHSVKISAKTFSERSNSLELTIRSKNQGNVTKLLTLMCLLHVYETRCIFSVLPSDLPKLYVYFGRSYRYFSLGEISCKMI